MAGALLMATGQPNPTGTGRYCAPLRCYCGSCPGYDEQVAAAELTYQREVRRALRAIEAAENAQHAQSWANRSDSTWIDTL